MAVQSGGEGDTSKYPGLVLFKFETIVKFSKDDIHSPNNWKTFV